MGQGFVPDRVEAGARVLRVMDMPTQYEVRSGEANAGMSCEAYDSNYARHAGPVSSAYTFMIRCRGDLGGSVPRGKRLKDAAEHCRVHDNPVKNIELVVAVGKAAARLLRPDVGSITDWYGYIIPEAEVADETV